jgi:CarD family transcriptional regulator
MGKTPGRTSASADTKAKQAAAPRGSAPARVASAKSADKPLAKKGADPQDSTASSGAKKAKNPTETLEKATPTVSAAKKGPATKSGASEKATKAVSGKDSKPASTKFARDAAPSKVSVKEAPKKVTAKTTKSVAKEAPAKAAPAKETTAKKAVPAAKTAAKEAPKKALPSVKEAVPRAKESVKALPVPVAKESAKKLIPAAKESAKKVVPAAKESVKTLAIPPAKESAKKIPAERPSAKAIPAERASSRRLGRSPLAPESSPQLPLPLKKLPPPPTLGTFSPSTGTGQGRMPPSPAIGGRSSASMPPLAPPSANKGPSIPPPMPKPQQQHPMKRIMNISDPPPAVEMTLNIGDNAVHLKHGVGEVVAIESMPGLGNFYRFILLDDRTKKFMVPTNGQTVLRPIMSANEADTVIETMRAKEVAVNEHPWSRRFRVYQEMINSGSPFEVAKVMRDMHRLKFDKDLSFGERVLLDRAKSLLMKELALAKGITEEDLQTEVTAIFST